MTEPVITPQLSNPRSPCYLTQTYSAVMFAIDFYNILEAFLLYNSFVIEELRLLVLDGSHRSFVGYEIF